MIVALGDSLTAGYGLACQRGLPAKLERALKAKGMTSRSSTPVFPATPHRAGCRGSTGRCRTGTDAVILELGANDALRGIDPDVTRKALTPSSASSRSAISRFFSPGCGRRPISGRLCARIRCDLSGSCRRARLIFYPFFLDGVAADRTLNLRDGVHPTAAGVDAIVKGILPKAEELIGRVNRSGSVTAAVIPIC